MMVASAFAMFRFTQRVVTCGDAFAIEDISRCRRYAACVLRQTEQSKAAS
jgi:hypothetical protein